MGFPPRIAIATRNPHKIKELARICADWPVSWLTIHDEAAAPMFPEVEETGETYLANAALKARAVAAALGEAALADDSGIEVDALGGRPGVRSARYAGERATDEENLHELLRALKGVPGGGRTARYRCLAVLASPDGTITSAEGVCEGILLNAGRGAGGFGYDPVFVPAGWERTMAELPPEEKDRISHRGKAFRALRAAIDEGDGPQA
jgi:XTP/dITP diphosphohydrolase